MSKSSSGPQAGHDPEMTQGQNDTTSEEESKRQNGVTDKVADGPDKNDATEENDTFEDNLVPHHMARSHSRPRLSISHETNQDIKNLLNKISNQDHNGQIKKGEKTDHLMPQANGNHSRKHSRQSSRRQSNTPGDFPKLFVQLDELCEVVDSEDDDEEEDAMNKVYEWVEKARWVKFEEDVEEGSERWGKPHVASLSFHSLLELRRQLARGQVLLDESPSDFVNLIDSILDTFVAQGQLTDEHKSHVFRKLNLKQTRRFSQRRSSLWVNSSGRHGRQHSSISGQRALRRNSSKINGSLNSRRSSDASISPSLQEKPDNDSNTVIDMEMNKDGGVTDVTVPSKTLKSSLSENALDHKAVTIVEGHTNHAFDEGDEQQPHHHHAHKRQSLSHILHGYAHTHGHHPHGHHSDIEKCLSAGSEAASVLVGTLPYLKKPIMAFVRLADGYQFGDLTQVPGLPARFLFLIFGPPSHQDYYEIGRSMSTLLADTMFREAAFEANNRQDLLDAINEFLDDSLVLPPGDLDRETLLPILDMAEKKKEKKRLAEQRKHKALVSAGLELAIKEKADESDKEEEYDPLKRTKRLFGGLVNDIKKRYPLYLSDIKDGLNPQCLAAFFFMYFACLSPAITFGGLIGDKTDNWMGVSENLLMTCIAGLTVSLFAAQPLLIAGLSGPILVFEEALYQACISMNLEFLPFRAWVGFWITILGILIVMFEGSVIMRYVTRFLEEIYSTLISLIFIYEVFRKLYLVFRDHPLQILHPMYLPSPTNNSYMLNDSMVTDFPFDVNSTMTTLTQIFYDPELNQPNTALLSLILTFGTFGIAWWLRMIKTSHFLGKYGRRALGDFGVPIAMIIMVLIDFAIHDAYTTKLDVPDGLAPTASYKRGWFINPIGMTTKLPIWAYFAAVIPALLAAILIYLETLITSMIVSKKDHNLKKGTGYHMDVFLIGLLASVSGIMGLPLVTAATVRSISHASALKVFSKSQAPGEKPKLNGIIEQRVTGFGVHIFIGVSVLMGPLLRQVPLAVLFGVFLYMGVASLSGVQLFDRIILFFKPIKYHPDEAYVKRVKTWRMHLFTFIQLICLAILWAVKSTKAAIGFPFFILLLIPVRLKLLGYVFTEKEIYYLDRKESGSIKEEEEDVD